MTLLHPIPTDQRRPLLKRLLIVWAMALVIALMTWSGVHKGRLDISLVYSFAISTSIWALTDVPRFVLRELLRSQPPHHWPPPWRASGMLLVGIPVGYALGTSIGDAYTGHSTWDLLISNQQRFTGLLVSSVAISLAFVAYFYQRSKSEAIAHQAREAQLLLLQSQLQPHMLFNTLAHVRALIGLDAAQAQTMLDHLDDYLRASLLASRSSWHSLAQEFARIEDYLALMAIRMGPRLQLHIDLPTDLRQVSVPTFILQPLVENAIRHGLEPKIEGGQLRVQALLHMQGKTPTLQLTVHDTGLGLHPAPSTTAEPLAHSGYGLVHVRDRLAQLFGQAGQLSLSPGPEGGCVARLSWPLALCPLPHPETAH
jgi:two-component sensor histidine kinase